MNLFTRTFLLMVLIVAMFAVVSAQGDDKVDVFTSVTAPGKTSDCKKFVLGKPVLTIAPDYPQEARSQRLGGEVRVEFLIDTAGKVEEIFQITGDELLQRAAREAALLTKFSSSKCDGSPVPVNGLLIFNFVPLALTDVYVVREKAIAYPDVFPGSPFFESIVSLTENYKISFGYADGKFHPDAPLTKGDFSHFLRMTLDLLHSRAAVSNKSPREIDLYFPSNPLQLRSTNSIVDFDPTKPYADSVKILMSRYDIVLTNEKREFAGKLPLTYNEVMGMWKSVFGENAVPVNFSNLAERDRIMNRGEFSLFLHESLFVLTYKVLP